MLSSDFQVEHFLALFLFFAELFKHDFSLVSLSLQLVHQFHLHLSLSLKVFGFLISIGDTAPLNFVLKLQVMLIHGALLRQNIINLVIAHLFLVFEVLDLRLGN